MSEDLWGDLTGAGAHAKLMLGNPYARYETEDIIHAWVVAEVEPGRWVAFEATNGRSYVGEDFRRGLMYNTPEDMTLAVTMKGRYIKLGRVVDEPLPTYPLLISTV